MGNVITRVQKMVAMAVKGAEGKDYSEDDTMESLRDFMETRKAPAGVVDQVVRNHLAVAEQLRTLECWPAVLREDSRPVHVDGDSYAALEEAVIEDETVGPEQLSEAWEETNAPST